MTSLIMKKKKYKFQVDFTLDELSNVPFLNAVLFAKVRLHDGGNFSEQSPREEVLNHTVKWGTKFSFTCKMSANASTGILESCVCRVSVRTEEKGGRSFQRLGFADIDLAQFAGAGLTTRRYLLEGYNTKHNRQDNSTVKVTIEMTLLSGDPCFKAPSFYTSLFPTNDQSDDPQLNFDHKPRGDDCGGSVASGSSGFGSLPRKHRPSVMNPGDSTRVSADQLVNELLQNTNLEDSNEQGVGLALYVGKDGSATLGSRHAKSGLNLNGK